MTDIFVDTEDTRMKCQGCLGGAQSVKPGLDLGVVSSSPVSCSMLGVQPIKKKKK